MKVISPEYSKEHLLYLRALRNKNNFIKVMQYLLLISIIVLWEVSARLGWIDPFITSSPSRIVTTVAELYKNSNLLMHIGVTLMETVIGFLLGTLIGTLTAIMLWWSPALSRILIRIL